MPTRVIVDDGAGGARTKGKAGSEPVCGTVTNATYNVRDGRGKGDNGEEYIGVVSAARAMKMVGVDVAVLQETKIVDPAFVRVRLKAILFWRRQRIARGEEGLRCW